MCIFRLTYFIIQDKVLMKYHDVNFTVKNNRHVYDH